MNWIALGAVAEVVGAMGVILSLIYVALQVKHGTAAARQDTAIRVMEASVSVTKPLTGSREYSNLLFTTLQGEELPNPGDRLHVHAWMFASLKTIENAHYLFERGGLEAEVWENWQDWWSYWLRDYRASQRIGMTGDPYSARAFGTS